MLRVLLLEDEEILAKGLPTLLKDEGIDITGTESINEALELYSKGNFDVVLLDIMMPPADNMDAEKLDYGRITGVEVARRMKIVDPNIPIVAFTVLSDPEIREEMREAGIRAIINKPAEINEIINKLREVTGK